MNDLGRGADEVKKLEMHGESYCIASREDKCIGLWSFFRLWPFSSLGLIDADRACACASLRE